MKLPTHIGDTRIVATERKYAYIEESGVRMKLPRFTPALGKYPIVIDGVKYSTDGQVIGEAKLVNEK